MNDDVIVSASYVTSISIYKIEPRSYLTKGSQRDQVQMAWTWTPAVRARLIEHSWFTVIRSMDELAPGKKEKHVLLYNGETK